MALGWRFLNECNADNTEAVELLARERSRLQRSCERRFITKVGGQVVRRND
jgi:hypothetical protein